MSFTVLLIWNLQKSLSLSFLPGYIYLHSPVSTFTHNTAMGDDHGSGHSTEFVSAPSASNLQHQHLHQAWAKSQKQALWHHNCTPWHHSCTSSGHQAHWAGPWWPIKRHVGLLTARESESTQHTEPEQAPQAGSRQEEAAMPCWELHCMWEKEPDTDLSLHNTGLPQGHPQAPSGISLL